VVTDGLRRGARHHRHRGILLANRSLPWWVVGLSVMATQLSAVTMIGTTGQGATDGMKFVQFYFGLPIAMVILGVTLVPFLHGAKVYTAYEFLERRFDAKTRSLTALLFLLSRGMSCGAILSAPGIVFSAIFGWPVLWTVALIGIPTVIYTMIGGVKAVQYVDVRQMVLIVTALVMIVITLLIHIPVSPDAALRVAGTAGRMQVFDFSFDLTKRYTFWSGIIGGTFLMLSYFGTGPEPGAALPHGEIGRGGAQLAVDECVLEDPAPGAGPARRRARLRLLRVHAGAAAVQPRARGARARRAAAGVCGAGGTVPDGLRRTSHGRAGDGLVRRGRCGVRRGGFRRSWRRAPRRWRWRTASPVKSRKDVNYVIPSFVLHQLPLGLAGIFIAAVMAAAMNAIAAELNSLSTATCNRFL
jgi:Na+/proline symporter